MNPHHRTQRIVAIFALFVGATGLAVLYLSFSLPAYEVVKPYADSISLRGFVDFFTPAFYERIRLNVRVVGLLLLGAGSVLFAARRRISSAIAGRISALPAEARDLAAFCRPRQRNRWFTLALTAIIASGALLRLAFLSQPIMSWDEAATFLTYASRPLYIVLSDYSAPNNHVLHTLLVYISYHLFGDALWAIRLPAFIAGILIIPATALVAHRLYGRWSALLSAALTAAAPILVDYSTDARGYTLLGLLFLLAVLCGACLIQKPANGLAWILFVVACALGLYTIPIMLYGIAMLSTWMLLAVWVAPHTRDERLRFAGRLIAAGLAALALALLLYAPVLVVSGLGSIISNGYVASLALPELAVQLPRSLQDTATLWFEGQPAILIIVLFAGAIIGITAPGTREYSPPLLAVSILAGLVMIAIQRVAPYPRTWLFLLPIIYMTAGHGLYRIGQLMHDTILRIGSRRWLSAAPVLSIVLCIALAVNTCLVKTTTIAQSFNAENIAVYLKGFLRPGDSVYFSPNQPLRYWFRLLGIPDEYVMLAKTPVPQSITRALIVVDDTVSAPLAPADTVTIPYSRDYLYAPVLIRSFDPGLLYQAQVHYDRP